MLSLIHLHNTIQNLFYITQKLFSYNCKGIPTGHNEKKTEFKREANELYSVKTK